MKNKVEVLILSGGKGTRLQTVVKDVPKPMAEISNKPFLEFLVNNFKRQGFHNICFLTGHKASVIVKHFGSEYRYSHEETPLGTGGAVKQAIESSHFDRFIVINGDSFFNIDYGSFLDRTFNKFDFTIALKRMNNVERYGAVRLNDQGRIIKFEEKSGSKSTESSAFINAGVYYLTKELVTSIKSGFISLDVNSICLLTSFFGIEIIELTPVVFCDVIAVIAVIA